MLMHIMRREFTGPDLNPCICSPPSGKRTETHPEDEDARLHQDPPPPAPPPARLRATWIRMHNEPCREVHERIGVETRWLRFRFLLRLDQPCFQSYLCLPA